MKTATLRDFRRVMPNTTRQEWAALLAREATRQAVKSSYPKQCARLAALLYEHDREGRGLEEWSLEAAMIIEGMQSTGDLAGLVARVLADSGFAGSHKAILNELVILFH